MIKHIWRDNKQWFMGKIALADIAKQFGTPCYVYSKQYFINKWQEFNSAFLNYPHQICYAVKANSNLSILNIFAKLNSGFDVVSIGEIERVLAAGGQPDKIVFSGVGKTEEELFRALQLSIGCINIESYSELLKLNNIAINLNKKANIAIRINPDIAINSHPYISTGAKDNKFGVNILEAEKLYQLAYTLPGIKIIGIAFHIGSQIIALDPFLQAIDKILEFIKFLDASGIQLEHINIGGGLGVIYNNETVPTPTEYVKSLLQKLAKTNLTIYIEPGRSLVANGGILLTKVEYIKKQDTQDKYFAIVDAGMNDLLRPALYNAWHNITPIIINNNINAAIYDVVGPICETGDFLGIDRELAIQERDLLMVADVGAYGFSMSSNYNSRGRSAEVMVDGDNCYLVRRREHIQDLFNLEIIN